MVYMRGRYKYFRMITIFQDKTPRIHRITRTSHALTLICLAIRLDSSLPQTGQLIVLGILPSSQAINISSVENSAPQPMQRIIFPFIIQEIVFGPRTLSMLSSDFNHPCKDNWRYIHSRAYQRTPNLPFQVAPLPALRQYEIQNRIIVIRILALARIG